MSATVLITATTGCTRLALLEEGRLAEYALEHDGGGLVGSIFSARVERVLPSLQAAFLDLGLSQNGFLYLEKGSQLTEGQQLLVQVSKAPRGNKGPTCTRQLSLAGRYAVLLVGSRRLGLSKKLTDSQTRQRLSALYAPYLEAGYGLVVRTAAQTASDQVLRQEVEALIGEYQALAARSRLKGGGGLLHRELSLPLRLVRDYGQGSLERVVCDQASLYRRLQDLLADLPEGERPALELYQGREPLFAYAGLEEEVAGLTARRVELPGGGYLVIDQTEAMTIIDVNSGTYAASPNLGETSRRINLAAAAEVARQLRLRDIGGIIIVDFIDMRQGAYKEELLAALRAALARDRMQPKLVELTALNLVELTRKQARPSLLHTLTAPCPVCGGSGRVPSLAELEEQVKERLGSLLKTGGASRELELVCHPYLAQHLRGELRALERQFHCSLSLRQDAGLPLAAFQLLGR